MTRRSSRALPFLLAIAFCGLTAPDSVEGQEPAEVAAMAIYRSTEAFHGDIPDSEVRFNVTDRDTIRELLSSIDFSDPRNGDLLGSIIDLFVYLKSSDGTVAAYEVYLGGRYFAHRDKRERSYPVSEEGRAFFRRLAQ